MKIRNFSLWCGLAIVAIVVSAATPDRIIEGKILSVGDGDTLTMSQSKGDRATIRLACIDAPEIAQKPWGESARDRLRELLPVGQEIRVRQITVDRYRRIVGEVFISGELANLNLTRSGHVVVYRQYLRGCDQTKYIEAENYARANKLNFWTQATPVMPWQYRASRRKK